MMNSNEDLPYIEVVTALSRHCHAMCTTLAGQPSQTMWQYASLGLIEKEGGGCLVTVNSWSHLRLSMRLGVGYWETALSLWTNVSCCHVCGHKYRQTKP